jgi:hypothetical protein
VWPQAAPINVRIDSVRVLSTVTLASSGIKGRSFSPPSFGAPGCRRARLVIGLAFELGHQFLDHHARFVDARAMRQFDGHDHLGADLDRLCCTDYTFSV